MLRISKVRAVVDATQAERWRHLEMVASEAIAMISIIARANIADAFDERGKLLPVHLWPETVSLAVRTFRIGKNGSFSLTLRDGLRAAELIAVATGRLKHKAGVVHTFDHVKCLAGAEVPWP
jgi:hypothetical protein